MTDKYFFIVGLHSCGTTLLSRIIDSHPDVTFIRDHKNNHWEETLIAKLMDKCDIYFPSPYFYKVVSEGYHQLATFQVNNAKNFTKKLVDKLGQRKTCLKHNRLFYCKNFVDAALPNSKRIIILRNGRSFATSSNHWQRGVNAGVSKLINRAKSWNILIKDYYLKDWKKDKKTITIKYEDLCKNTYITIKKICEFISLDPKKIKKLLLNDEFLITNRTDKWDALNNSYKTLVSNEILDTEEIYENI